MSSYAPTEIAAQGISSLCLVKMASPVGIDTALNSPGTLKLLPAGAWDSHVHVIDEGRYPFHPDYPYRPRKAELADLLRFERSIGVDHVCLVNMSVYKTDNKLLLESLQRLRGKGRGVAVIDPESVSEDELDEMHRVGVRGVRVNLKTEGQTPAKDGLLSILHSHERRIRTRGWVLEIYLSMPQFKLIAEEIPKLRVRVVIDHLGHPQALTPAAEQTGYNELMDLLRKGQIWVKLSGTYRFAELPGLESYAREVIKTAPTQIVWASDWPHSGSVENNPGGNRHNHQDYRKVDDIGFIKQCIEWCDGDLKLIQTIFVDNPRELWQYHEPIQASL